MIKLQDLVSRGKNTSGINQCWGAYNDDTQTGWGPAYQYSCIHSGIISASDLATTWYNYTLATVGTIIDENTTSSNPVTNTTTATESICPKGWTLPNKAQIDAQTNVAAFSPVFGGNYANAVLNSENTYGFWWGSEAFNGGRRYTVYYHNNRLYSGGARRRDGSYIRCVQKS